uniref:Uncharacterized protein n=1 Tax=Romanomermis culicivorax TaxID=13658 RepID=A0A915IPT8_ROMCU
MLQSLNSDMDPVLTAAYDQREMPTTNLAQKIVFRNIIKEFERQKELQKQYQQMQRFQQQAALPQPQPNSTQTVVPSVQVIRRGTPTSLQEQHLLDMYPKTVAFHIENDVLFQKARQIAHDQVVVPSSLRDNTLHQYHSVVMMTHQGFKRTLAMIKKCLK